MFSVSILTFFCIALYGCSALSPEKAPTQEADAPVTWIAETYNFNISEESRSLDQKIFNSAPSHQAGSYFCVSTFTWQSAPVCRNNLIPIGTINFGSYYGSANVYFHQVQGSFEVAIEALSSNSYINVVGAVVSMESSAPSLPTTVFNRSQNVRRVSGRFSWWTVAVRPGASKCCNEAAYVHVTLTICRTSTCSNSNRSFSRYISCGTPPCL